MEFDDLPELARAITFLAAAADEPGVIPDPMRAILGPAADSDAQDDLAAQLLRAAQHSADPHLLDAGLILMGAAVAASDDDHPRLTDRLAMLVIAYLWRHRRTHRPADLDDAIDAGERAVAVGHEDHPDFAAIRSNLGIAYRERAERTGSPPDLTRSIELGRQALAVSAGDGPDRGVFLFNLALAHFRRYESTGRLADLKRAIELYERMLAGERPGTTPLIHLCVAYRERYERTGAPADLKRAIEMGERALAALNEHGPERAAATGNLNLAYRRRYERTGELNDLQRAIDFGEQSLGARAGNTMERASSLGNLSTSLQRRYEHTGEPADLQRAIDLDEEALAIIPEDHPMRVNSLSNLCVAYERRAGHREDSGDLARAIELGEQALTSTPDGHPGRVITMAHLGTAYRKRYESHRDVADLDRSLELAHLALAALPADHPNRYMYLTDLNIAYQRRSEHSGDEADARRGIAFQEQALAATPDGHPALATQLANLGQAYYTLADRGGPVRQEDLRPLVDRLTGTTATTPGDRVRAHHIAGRLATVLGDNELAVRLLDTAAALLPSLPSRDAGLADQEQLFDGYVGLVRECIAAHCATNDPGGAVRAAELSRGILLAAQLDSRTELTDLHRTDPGLAAEFRRTTEQLSARDTRTDRRRLWERRDDLLARIRRIDGHADFLLPPHLPELKAAAGDAAILVNTTLRHGDAIIVKATGDPILIPLPDLGGAELHDTIQSLIDVAQDAGLAATLRRQRVITEILGWLWDVAVAPILAALPPAEATPRVWWMPTDLLSLFPWHAAGRPGRPGALDAVISSYTATLRTLAHARRRPQATVRKQLTVAMPHTPGAPDLPGTATEARLLHAAHPDLPLLVDRHATTKNVLTALREATWAHFACHADADLLAPSRSGLRLHDDVLSLPAISRLHLTDAELAYLSACSTANPGVRRADESLHLASAFQLAGFRHVIATLWPVSDDLAATTARVIYGHLATATAADNAAIAVRQTALDLRAAHPTRPDLWAPLIHYGP